MRTFLHRFSRYRDLGIFIFNRNLRVEETNEPADSFVNRFHGNAGRNHLLSIFPELVGNEKELEKVISGKKEVFILNHLNRVNRDGTVCYLNVAIFAGEAPETGILTLEDVTRQARLQQEINQQKNELLLYQSSLGFRRHFLQESILGDSPAIQKVRQTIEKLSKAPKATVLLLGESGTGKNLVGRVIHYSSMPPEAPFVEINCAALPENLLESELFGYEKGAFTHATASKAGLFEEAGGGTIFLDEIGDLPLKLQAKLLSVLETKKFRRLGSNKPIEVNLRIMAATNRDLARAVEEKQFREDLFFRLNVVSLTLPPLRTMGRDILLIARHFLKIYQIEFKKPVKGFSETAEQALLAYPWPGNARELSNCLERAMIFLDKEYIDAEDLIFGKTGDSPAPQRWTVPPDGIHLEEVERDLILSALQQTNNNKSKAARLLGLSRDTLRYRMEKYQLE